MASRTYLMEMKKDLAKVCPILEAIMRHKENFKAKGIIFFFKHNFAINLFNKLFFLFFFNLFFAP